MSIVRMKVEDFGTQETHEFSEESGSDSYSGLLELGGKWVGSQSDFVGRANEKIEECAVHRPERNDAALTLHVPACSEIFFFWNTFLCLQGQREGVVHVT